MESENAMRRLLRQGIDRRYVLVPLVAAIALVIAAFVVAEARRNYTRDLSEAIVDRQEGMREVAEVIYATLDAESAQRGYLLTGEPQYVTPYDESAAAALSLLDGVIRRYERIAPEEVPVLMSVRQQLEEKLAETAVTIQLMRDGRPRDALAAVKTDVGLRYMREIRTELEALRTRDRERIYAGLLEWNRGVRVNALVNAAMTAFTVALLIFVGLLATSEIRRRHEATAELERLVAQSTDDLRELSTHMIRIAEREKSALARELHDELGGLLVTMRMDLSQLRRRIVLPDDDAATRWQRIDAALTAGVELKRRVIEELRPTLLDNMGLISAVRWQAEQACAQGGLSLELDLPEEEPQLQGDAPIAVFRSVQEALSNVLKHARATRVRLSMHVDDGRLRVTIEDDGIGLPQGADRRAGAHGLKQIRFRMRAVGGAMHAEPASPRGTRMTLTLPI